MPISAPTIRPSDSIRQVLAQHPTLYGVFERHGLSGCGGAAGPDEAIDRFAAVHRVDAAMLLAELNAALRSGAAGPTPAPALPPADTLYRPFIYAALVCTLTLGATFGAYNLLSIQLALGPVPPPHNWVHASFQLFGFVLLFVMGVAYHALPRFLSTTLARPGAARASLWLVLLGLVLRAYGQFGALLPSTDAAYRLGAASLLAGVLAFAFTLGSTWRRAR